MRWPVSGATRKSPASGPGARSTATLGRAPAASVRGSVAAVWPGASVAQAVRPRASTPTSSHCRGEACGQTRRTVWPCAAASGVMVLGASGCQVQRCVASSRTESTRPAPTTTMRSSPTWRVPPVTEPSLTVLPVRRSIEELSGLTMARSATTTPEMAVVAQSPDSPSVAGRARAGTPTPRAASTPAAPTASQRRPRSARAAAEAHNSTPMTYAAGAGMAQPAVASAIPAAAATACARDRVMRWAAPAAGGSGVGGSARAAAPAPRAAGWHPGSPRPGRTSRPRPATPGGTARSPRGSGRRSSTT